MKTRRSPPAPGTVPLGRALSKLGVASRAETRTLVRAGRVAVNGRVIRDPATPVVPERARIAVDGAPVSRDRPRRLIAFHKPRGVVTTRRDPDGRRTVFDVLGEAGHGLIAVGRLDLASTGLLLLTNDTHLANRLTDPASHVPRRYVVTVRGQVEDAALERMRANVAALEVHKRSARETHLLVTLTRGRNREIRRLFAGEGHEVTRLHRIAFGDIELERLQPGEWRIVDGEPATAARGRVS